MGFGSISYAADNEGWILSTTARDSANTFWANQLVSYVSNETTNREYAGTDTKHKFAVFLCPSESAELKASTIGEKKRFSYTHYGHNNMGFGYASNKKESSTTNGKFRPRQESALLAPSLAQIFADTTSKTSPGCSYGAHMAWRHGGDVTPSETEDGKQVQYPGGTGCNVVFYDGHAETVQNRKYIGNNRKEWFHNGIIYLDGKQVIFDWSDYPKSSILWSGAGTHNQLRLDVFGVFFAAPHHIEKFFHGKFAHLIKVLADGGYGWICTLHPNRVVIAYELDFFADTSNTQVAYINSYSYQGSAYRHGGDVSFTKSETTQFKYNGNAVNMNYMDGHAETVSRDSLNAIANNTLIFREGIDHMDRKPVK